MLNPPPDFDESCLVAALADNWRLRVASMAYQPVGFGSHHWAVTDLAGRRWFVTVDDLPEKRCTAEEAVPVTHERLCAALGTAVDLRASGLGFVVAPDPARDGAPAVRLADTFAVAVYPHISGRAFAFGDLTSAHRDALLHLLIALHAVPLSAARRARVEDHAIPHRDVLEATLDGIDGRELGPYSRPATELITAHANAVRHALLRYDRLTETTRNGGSLVVTHGEPHPGNTMLGADGWLLLDWDTTLIAPPERDLWSLDPGDGSLLAAYADATGFQARPDALELYRRRWALADLAVDINHFRRPHGNTANDKATWENLMTTLDETH